MQLWGLPGFTDQQGPPSMALVDHRLTRLKKRHAHRHSGSCRDSEPSSAWSKYGNIVCSKIEHKAIGNGTPRWPPKPPSFRVSNGTPSLPKEHVGSSPATCGELNKPFTAPTHPGRIGISKLTAFYPSLYAGCPA